MAKQAARLITSKDQIPGDMCFDELELVMLYREDLRFGERWSMQKAMCCMMTDFPEIRVEELAYWMPKAFDFSTNYDTGRAKVDFRKFNNADFKCQQKRKPIEPVVFIGMREAQTEEPEPETTNDEEVGADLVKEAAEIEEAATIENLATDDPSENEDRDDEIDGEADDDDQEAVNS